MFKATFLFALAVAFSLLPGQGRSESICNLNNTAFKFEEREVWYDAEKDTIITCSTPCYKETTRRKTQEACLNLTLNLLEIKDEDTWWTRATPSFSCDTEYVMKSGSTHFNVILLQQGTSSCPTYDSVVLDCSCGDWVFGLLRSKLALDIVGEWLDFEESEVVLRSGGTAHGIHVLEGGPNPYIFDIPHGYDINCTMACPSSAATEDGIFALITSHELKEASDDLDTVEPRLRFCGESRYLYCPTEDSCTLIAVADRGVNPTLTCVQSLDRLEGRGASFCFSADTTVQVLNKGVVNMRDVEVGDSIYVGTGNYEPVYAYGHWSKTTTADFLQVYTFGNHHSTNNPLEISPRHLVYIQGRRNPVTADSLQVGDILQTDSGSGGTIIKIQPIIRHDGVYAPLTPSGKIVVDNDIVASTYVSLQKKGGSEFAEFSNGMILPISQHQGIHMGTSPFRILCMGVSSSSFCGTYTNDTGILWWVDYGIRLGAYVEDQHVLVQLLWLLLALAVCLPFYGMEIIFGPRLAPLAFAAGLLVYILSNGSKSKRE